MLNSDPANAEALGALGGLYERSKDFDKLVEVLEKQVEVTYDNGAEGPDPHASSARSTAIV